MGAHRTPPGREDKLPLAGVVVRPWTASPACSPGPYPPASPWAIVGAEGAHATPPPRAASSQDTQAGTVQGAGQDNRVPFVAGIWGCHWRPGVGGEGMRRRA